MFSWRGAFCGVIGKSLPPWHKIYGQRKGCIFKGKQMSQPVMYTKWHFSLSFGWVKHGSNDQNYEQIPLRKSISPSNTCALTVFRGRPRSTRATLPLPCIISRRHHSTLRLNGRYSPFCPSLYSLRFLQCFKEFSLYFVNKIINNSFFFCLFYIYVCNRYVCTVYVCMYALICRLKLMQLS